MFRLFLLIILGSSSIWCSDFLKNYDDRFESKLYSLSDTTDQSNRKDTQEEEPVYPARSLVRSLIVPGWGQIYNKSPWWKTFLFLGVEVAALWSWRNWNQKAEDIRLDYELFADSNWTLNNWITNTTELQGAVYEELEDLGYTWDPDVHIIGTHSLDILYNDQIYSSDCLYDLDWTEEQGGNDCILPDTPEDLPEILYNTEYIPGLISDGSITVIKDCHFYENTGKYDQFVAGWEGILENYVIQFVDVGDSTEINITSPIKEEYINLFNSETQ